MEVWICACIFVLSTIMLILLARSGRFKNHKALRIAGMVCAAGVALLTAFYLLSVILLLEAV